MITMKRCEVCHQLTDNGDQRCPRCGSPFPYNPRLSLFSETRIFLILLVLGLVAWRVYESLPLLPPDPAVCSQTSFNRFKKIVVRAHTDATNILAENYISSANLSKIMTLKREAEALPVPACLEAAKEDFVAYMEALYYSAVLSAWNGYESATLYVESAANYLNALNAHLDEVKACLPDCP